MEWDFARVPPRDPQILNLISQRDFVGGWTGLGRAGLLGGVLRARLLRVGRRKLYLKRSLFPMAVVSVLEVFDYLVHTF